MQLVCRKCSERTTLAGPLRTGAIVMCSCGARYRLRRRAAAATVEPEPPEQGAAARLAITRPDCRVLTPTPPVSLSQGEDAVPPSARGRTRVEIPTRAQEQRYVETAATRGESRASVLHTPSQGGSMFPRLPPPPPPPRLLLPPFLDTLEAAKPTRAGAGFSARSEFALPPPPRAETTTNSGSGLSSLQPNVMLPASVRPTAFNVEAESGLRASFSWLFGAALVGVFSAGVIVFALTRPTSKSTSHAVLSQRADGVLLRPAAQPMSMPEAAEEFASRLDRDSASASASASAASTPNVANESAEPAVSEPTQTKSGKPIGFNRFSTKRALSKAAVQVNLCSAVGRPSGDGLVHITFAPSGSIQELAIMTPKFLDASIAECVLEKFRGVTVEPFEGSAVLLSKAFFVPAARKLRKKRRP